MARWLICLIVFTSLLVAGCGSEHERGKNSKGDRPKRGDKSSRLIRPALPVRALV